MRRPSVPAAAAVLAALTAALLQQTGLGTAAAAVLAALTAALLQQTGLVTAAAAVLAAVTAALLQQTGLVTLQTLAHLTRRKTHPGYL
jgi:hypothetical protein